MKERLSLKLLTGCFIAASLLTGIQEVRAEGGFEDGFLVRVRGIAVAPDESSFVTPIGGDVTIDTAYVPELDISYFLNKNFAVELILATSEHDAGATGTTLGNLDLGDFWLLPPTLLAQYHLPLGKKFKPYVGTGINYSMTYGEDAAGGTVTDFELDNGIGWAAQVGIDYMIDEHWLINADVKKLWVNLDARLNNGAITADIDVDPWIIGFGVGYRF